MQPRILTCVAVVAAVLTLSISIATAQERTQTQRYYVFNLGDPGGGSLATAASINNIGWIAGEALQAGSENVHAELWVGAPFDLGTLGGPNSVVAWPNKNNRGQITGVSETADVNPLNEAWSCAQANFLTITNHVCYGFLWEAGVMTALPPLSGGIDSYAASINNKGQVAGWAENGVHDQTCNNTSPINQVLQFEAVVWGPKLGQMTQLSPLGADPDSAATAISDKGQIVGISGLCANAAGSTSAEHAVLWENEFASPIDLGNFDGGLAWNTPTSLNNRGQVVGFGNQQGSPATSFNPIAFFWDSAHGIQSLAPIGTDTQSWAWGINAHGQVVGQSFNLSTGAARAFLYEHGVLTDLNTLIQANSSLQLLLANDINDAGEVVGFALDMTTNATVAFLAFPVHSDNQSFARPDENNFYSRGATSGRRPFAGTFSRFAVDAAHSK